MSAILTTAGAAHLVELAQGSMPANAFDGLVLGAGNDDPSSTDTLASISQRELLPALKLVDGYPKQGDSDARNGGRGSETWTWRFEKPAGAPFVASNVAVTNYSGGALMSSAPLLVSAKQTLAQRYDERLIVWVNADASAPPTVFTAAEQALENRVQRVVGFVARSQALSGSPAGSVVDADTVVTRPQRTRDGRTQSVWTAARVIGRDGNALQPGDVESFVLTALRLGTDGVYIKIPTGIQPECESSISGTLIQGDIRWNAGGGYNIHHLWRPLRGTTEGTYRLEYTLTLCDGDIRTWTNQVEVR